MRTGICRLVPATIAVLVLHVGCAKKENAPSASGEASTPGTVQSAASDRDLRNENAVDAVQWWADIQKIGVKYETGKQQDVRGPEFEEFRKDFEAATNGQIVDMPLTVERVTWDNGIAEVRVKETLPKENRIHGHVPGFPVMLYRSMPVELNCTQAEADEILPGAPLRLRAVLAFVREYSLKNDPRWGQVVYVVSNRNFQPLGVAGTLVTTDYVVDIDGRPFRGRWAK